MTVSDLFSRVRAALESAQVPYMLTGSFASSAHGAVRATQDIDIVIAPNRQQLLTLLGRFPEDAYYVSQEAALDALSRQGQFNVIDFASGWKIDLIIRKARAFSLEEFERRVSLDVSGISLDVATAEDTVISKLEWAKLGGSSRQIDDVAGVLRMQRGLLDLGYVERWVRALGIEEQWREAQARAA